jgi:hypothetical protein
VPKVVIAVEGADAKDVSLSVDGTPLPAAVLGIATPVDPGPHVFAGKTTSSRSEPVKVTLAEGATEKVTLKFSAVAQETPEPSKTDVPTAIEQPQAKAPGSAASSSLPMWVSLGVGAAGLVAGGVFVVLNHVDRSSANDECGSGACPASKRADIDSLDSQANTASTLSWVSFGVAAAGLGTGAVLFLLRGNKPADAAPAARSNTTPPATAHASVTGVACGGLCVGLSGAF